MTHKTVRGWLGMLSVLIFTAILVISGGALADPPIPGGDDCGLELSAPISAVDIGGAVKATGVRDDVLDCYITWLLAAGVAPADIAEGLLLAGYGAFDVVRAIVIIGGAEVVVDVVARVNLVLGSTISQTVRDAVADAARVREARGADDNGSAAELMELAITAEITSQAEWLQPEDDAGGVSDASLK